MREGTRRTICTVYI